MTDNTPMPRVLYVNEPQERPDGSLMYEGDASRFHARHKYILAETMPADWHEDSSLAKWFPITAEELNRLRAATQPPQATDAQRQAALDDLDLLEEIGWFPEQDESGLAKRFERIRTAIQSPAVPREVDWEAEILIGLKFIRERMALIIGAADSRSIGKSLAREKNWARQVVDRTHTIELALLGWKEG